MVIQITSSQSFKSKPLISWTPQRSQRFYSQFFKYPFRSLHNVKYENSIAIWPWRFSNEAFWIFHSVKFETFDWNKLEDFFIKFYKFQTQWNKKTLIITILRHFPSNRSSFAYSQYKTLTARNLRDFPANFEFLYKWKFEKCVRGSLRFVAIKGHGKPSIHPISLAGAHEIFLSQVFEFLLISTVF